VPNTLNMTLLTEFIPPKSTRNLTGAQTDTFMRFGSETVKYGAELTLIPYFSGIWPPCQDNTSPNTLL